MFNSLLRNIPLTLLIISLILNAFLFFNGNYHKGEREKLSDEVVSLETDLRSCRSANEGWESSYDDLLTSCKIQSEVIIELGKDLHEERKESGDVIREILLMPPEQQEQGDKDISISENTTTSGETNEIQIPYAPPVAGLDDRLPDSLYEALQRSYNGSKAPAAPNP